MLLCGRRCAVFDQHRNEEWARCIPVQHLCLHGGVAVTAPGIFESITTTDIFAHIKKAAIVGTHHVELFFEAVRFNAIEQRIPDTGPTAIMDPGAEAFSGIEMDSV